MSGKCMRGSEASSFVSLYVLNEFFFGPAVETKSEAEGHT